MKRLLALIAMLAAVFSLFSCDRRYNEQEVKAAAERLLKESVVLNEIFYGKGIPYINDENRADGAYYEADFSYLNGLGIETVDDIKNMASGVFTKAYCEQIFSTVLSPVSEDDNIYYMARYYQKRSAATDEAEAIMVYSLAKIFLQDSYEHDFSTLRVEGSKGERVYVSVVIRVVDSESEKEYEMTRRIALIEEKDGWRVDSPTFAQYSEDNAYYEDLQNKK